MTAFHIQRLPLHPAIAVRVHPHGVVLQGPLGTMHVDTCAYDPKSLMAFKVVQDAHHLSTMQVYAPSKHMLKTFCSVFTSHMEGLTQGFMSHLECVGVGYKIMVQDHEVVFRVGLSHTVSCMIPPDIQLFTPKPTQLIVFGVDKQRVTHVVSQLRAIKLPEPYKGKGLRLKTEHVLRKEGKKK
jgi:ribosomal protein L6P/L9E